MLLSMEDIYPSYNKAIGFLKLWMQIMTEMHTDPTTFSVMGLCWLWERDPQEWDISAGPSPDCFKKEGTSKDLQAKISLQACV